jgi:predicted lactoylglutathione lyase
MHAVRTDSSLQRWDTEGGAPKVRRPAHSKRAAPASQVTPSLYYFNIRSERTLIEDPEGLTLPDLKAALQEALALARQSLMEGDRQGENRRDWRVEIMDRANEHVMTVAFNEVYSCGWPREDNRPDRARDLTPLVRRTMEQRLSVLSLGVRDLERSRAFYESLGWQCSTRSTEEVVFFQLGGIALSLLPRGMLAREADLPEQGSGFSGVTLAYNTRSKAEVEMVMNEAEEAGARIVKAAQSSAWGGNSGYFADPDGYLWEIAWNPGFDLADDGRITLPK